MLKFYEMFFPPKYFHLFPLATSTECCWILFDSLGHDHTLSTPLLSWSHQVQWRWIQSHLPTSLAEALPPSISRQIPRIAAPAQALTQKMSGRRFPPTKHVQQLQSWKFPWIHWSTPSISTGPVHALPRDCKRWMASNHCCCWPRTPKATDKILPRAQDRGRHCTTKGFSMPVMTQSTQPHIKYIRWKNHDWMKGLLLSNASSNHSHLGYLAGCMKGDN